MSVKVLTEHHLEFLSLKGGWTGLLSLHLPKCHIVGNHMSFVCFVALRPKSTAMVMAGRSVHLTTNFLEQA